MNRIFPRVAVALFAPFFFTVALVGCDDSGGTGDGAAAADMAGTGDGGTPTGADVRSAFGALLDLYGRELPGDPASTSPEGRFGIGGLVLVDLDGDGVSEIAGAFNGGDAVEIHRVLPGGGTAQVARLVVGTVAGMLRVASPSGPALAVAAQDPDRLLILPDASLTGATETTLPSPPSAIAAARLDGDAFDDIGLALGPGGAAVIALSSERYAARTELLGYRPGALTRRARPGRTDDLLYFSARTPEATGIAFENNALVPVSVGESIAPPPGDFVRVEAFSLDLDGDGPDDLVLRELGDLGRKDRLVAYVEAAGKWARGNVTVLGGERWLTLVDADADQKPDALLMSFSPGLGAVTFATGRGTALGGYQAALPLASTAAIDLLFGLGGVQVAAGILPTGFGCGGISNESNLDVAANAAFKQVLCDMLELLDDFAKSRPMSDEVRKKLESVIDEVRDQKAAGDISVGDLDGNVAGWTEPISGDIAFDRAYVNPDGGVPIDLTDRRFWQVLSVLVHEGVHADCMTGETSTTRWTERILGALYNDLGNPNGHFRSRPPLLRDGGAGGAGDGGVDGGTGGLSMAQSTAARDEIARSKWNECVYRHSCNGTFDSLAEELIEDVCDSEMDFNDDRNAAQRDYGGTITYPATVNCTTRCYNGPVTIAHCGITQSITVNFCD